MFDIYDIPSLSERIMVTRTIFVESIIILLMLITLQAHCYY